MPLRRRMMWGFTLLGCCALLLRLGWVHYKWHLDELEYREAIEEADRLDPGWRLEDLEAARAVIPDAENSALQVLAAHQLVPKNWFPLPDDPSKRLECFIDDLSPQEKLDDEQSQELSDELEKASAAVVAARRLVEMPRGRYTVAWTNDALLTSLPHLYSVREVSRLLWLHAVRQVEQGDTDGAFTSCQVILNTGRSIGDEPATISQLERLRCQDLALKSLERALAHGQASEAALESLQRLLQNESEQPLFLVGARGDRATMHQFLTVLKAGEFDRSAYSWLKTRRSFEVDDILDKKRAHASHGACLKYWTEYIEIGRLPLEQRLDKRPNHTMPPYGECSTLFEGCSLSFGDPFVWLPLAFGRRLALLRSGITAVAAERYRLVNERWPDRLDELVPGYLSKIPTDPFDGQRLRYKRLSDSVVVYSVGPDRIDDGGQIERIEFKKPGTDTGFQLWDPERRQQNRGDKLQHYESR
jgi:hypothetical protein